MGYTKIPRLLSTVLVASLPLSDERMLKYEPYVFIN
jgi:hypothetical protein